MKNVNSTNNLGMDSVKRCKAVAELGLSVTTKETMLLSRQLVAVVVAGGSFGRVKNDYILYIHIYVCNYMYLHICA